MKQVSESVENNTGLLPNLFDLTIKKEKKKKEEKELKKKKEEGKNR